MNSAEPHNYARRASRRIGHAVWWCRRHIERRPLAFIIATVIGLLAGFGAFLLKRMIGWLSTALTSGLNVVGPDWLLIVLPVIGIPLTGII